MPTKTDLELRVGIFVFIGFVLLFMVVFSVGDIYIFNPTYRLKLIYGFASGVELSAPVRLAGVTVGEVEDIRLFLDEKTNRTAVELTARIRRDAKIEEDAEAYINTLGLIGEKYVEIIPGSPGKRLLQDGERLIGYDPVSTEKLTQDAQVIVRDLQKTIAYVNDVIGNPQTRASLRATISNLDQTTDNMKAITGQVRSGEGSLGKLIMDDSLYRATDEMVNDLKKNPWKLLHKPKGAK